MLEIGRRIKGKNKHLPINSLGSVWSRLAQPRFPIWKKKGSEKIFQKCEVFVELGGGGLRILQILNIILWH